MNSFICSVTDCPEDSFHVELSSPNGRVRRRQIVDYLGRGLFLVQYRIYGDYSDISLSVTHAGEQVSKSPYPLGGMLHEDCFCPLDTVDRWLDKFDCPSELDQQIAEDLEPFKKGVNVTGLFMRAGNAYYSNSFIHYSIVDGKVGGYVKLVCVLCGVVEQRWVWSGIPLLVVANLV